MDKKVAEQNICASRFCSFLLGGDTRGTNDCRVFRQSDYARPDRGAKTGRAITDTSETSGLSGMRQNS